jgi:hypothetical protein
MTDDDILRMAKESGAYMSQTLCRIDRIDLLYFANLVSNLAVKEEREKEWVGLTDADINRLVDAIYKGFDIKPPNEIEIQYFERLIKFIEANLKEKNV